MDEAKASQLQQWKYNYHLSRTTDINKEDAAADTTEAAAETMAADNIEQITDKQAAAIKKADQEARKKADAEVQKAEIDAEEDTAAAEKAASVQNVEQVADKQAAADRTADQEAIKKADPEARQAGIKNKEDAAAEKRAAEEVEQAVQKQAAVEAQEDAIRDKAVAAVDMGATAIGQYATALAAAGRAVAPVSGEEFKGHRRAVRIAEIDAANRLGRTAKKAKCPSPPPSADLHKSQIHGVRTGIGRAFLASMTLAFYIYWTLRATKDYDAWLLQHIHNSVRPLQLNLHDLQAIHRQFKLYTFPLTRVVASKFLWMRKHGRPIATCSFLSFLFILLRTRTKLLSPEA